MKYYTGIGSRSTPELVLIRLSRIARHLKGLGYVLRSGGAPGADLAFEYGAGDMKEIYLPWKGFNDRQGIVADNWIDAMDLAARFHPAWQNCSGGARKLHARNGFQVLGLDLKTPSEFVVCWTRNGSGTGGTGQAIRIARSKNIPIYDLGNPELILPEFFNGI